MAQLQPPIQFQFNTSQRLQIYFSDKPSIKKPNALQHTANYSDQVQFDYGQTMKRFPRDCCLYLTIESFNQCSVSVKISEAKYKGAVVGERSVRDIITLPNLGVTERCMRLKAKVSDIVNNAENAVTGPGDVCLSIAKTIQKHESGSWKCPTSIRPRPTRSLSVRAARTRRRPKTT